MTNLADQYLLGSLVGGKPVCTFAPANYHRTITNIVVGNSVQGGVKCFRGSLSSVPVATNPLGINNTLSGSIDLPAGQIFFVQWDNVGTNGASDAFARVSFEDTSGNPLDVPPDSHSWAVDLITILVLPTGATTGQRIVLDASTDMIQIFDINNKLVAQLDPSGITAGNDLSNIPAANLVRMNVKDSVLANPGLEIQPGNTPAGNYLPATINTILYLNAGLPTEQQALAILSPAVSGTGGYAKAPEIELVGASHDGTLAGLIRLFSDSYTFFNHDGSQTLLIIQIPGGSTPLADLRTNTSLGGNRAVQLLKNGDANPGMTVDFDGRIQMGPGGASPTDTQIFRDGGGTVGINNTLNIDAPSASGTSFRLNVQGEANARMYMEFDGKHHWGPGGASGQDTTQYRSGSGLLATDGDYVVNQPGGGFRIKEGANARMGVTNLVSGSVTIATTAVTNASRIFAFVQTPNSGGTGVLRVDSRIAGTSFTIKSSLATDNAQIAWLIMEPA